VTVHVAVEDSEPGVSGRPVQPEIEFAPSMNAMLPDGWLAPVMPAVTVAV
jgi:hypothetical protein